MIPKQVTTRWFFWGVLVLALIANRWLVGAWLDDPLNRYGGISFLIWAAVPIVLCVRGFRTDLPEAGLLCLWVGALLLLMAGEMGSLQVLKQLGLAVLVASLLPGRVKPLLYLAAAASWTPAWGWFWTNQIGTALDPGRLALVVILALPIIFLPPRPTSPAAL